MKCGCKIIDGYEKQGSVGVIESKISYCPLHEAAPGMLEALFELINAADYVLEKGGDILTSASWHKARAAISQAERS